MDLSKMPKTALLSELNAMNYIDRWQRKDYEYKSALETELNNRILEDAIDHTKNTEKN